MKKIIALFAVLLSFTITNSFAQSSEENNEYLGKIIDTLGVETLMVVTETLPSEKTEKEGFFKRSLSVTGNTIKNSFSATKNFFKTSQYAITLPFGKSAVFGLDEYVGDRVDYADFWIQKNSATYSNPYGYTYAPLTLNLPSKILSQFSFALERKKWTFGVRAFSFNAKSGITDVITTPSPGIRDIYTGDGDTIYVSWLYSAVWSNNMGPLFNDKEKSWLSPIGYYFSNEFKFWSVDAFVLLDLYENTKHKIALDLGIKFLKPYYKLEAGIRQHAYVTEYWGPYDFENFVIIDSKHEASFGSPFKNKFLKKKLDVFLGPTAGIAYTYKKRFLVTPVLRFSLAAGRVNGFGDFDDNDYITYIDTRNGNTIDVHYKGYVPYAQTQLIIIPILEAGLNVEYPITDDFAIGVFQAYSVFYNMPLGPRWHNPWEQGPWALKVADIDFYSAAVNIKLSF